MSNEDKEFYDMSNVSCSDCGQVMLLDELRDARIKVMYCLNLHCGENMKVYEAPKIKLRRL